MLQPKFKRAATLIFFKRKKTAFSIMLLCASHASADICAPIAPTVFAVESSAEDTQASALSFSSDGVGRIVLEGDAELIHEGVRVNADRIEFDDSHGGIDASGSVSYVNESLALHSDSLTSSEDKETLSADSTHFMMRLNEGENRTDHPDVAYGSSSRVVRSSGALTVLRDTIYSTCAPGETGWQLSADELVLDSDEGQGVARGVVVEFGSVPIFYTPWLSFPINDKRRSGFLMPRIGNSDSRGFEISTPWYWNIAPQADATITPRAMSDRGLKLNTEWRYLQQRANWNLEADYLENDSQTDTRRYFTRLRHTGTPFEGWRSEIDAARVSDVDYFDDFDDASRLSNLTHLQRQAQLSHRRSDSFASHSLRVRLQEYQTVDESIAASSRPYQRLPQIQYNLDANARPLGLRFDLRSEVVRFERDDSVTGERLDLRPRVSMPLEASWGFLRPALTMWHTQYALNNVADGDEDQPSRSARVFSVDSGLIFERALESGTQTLEPRLFFVDIPLEAQDDIPVFDSHLYDFTFSQLFRENRFSSADRVGDTRQLTAAVTTRFLNENSREWASASIGQIHYLEDREVTLSGSGIDETDRSNLILQLNASFADHWSGRGSWQWNPETDAVERRAMQLSYRNGSRRVLHLGHRFREERYDLFDIALIAPVNANWTLAAHWNYELEEEETIDSLLSLEYQSCCFAFRTALRQNLRSDGEENGSVYFELVMKGLGNVGDDIGRRVDRDILGYSNSLN
ncbi:MAG: LPS assembly protein LptD [Pseudomonadota bacterium]